MFSFFKKKTQETDPRTELRQSVERLRAEIGDDAVMKGMQLNDRVNQLRSINPKFISSLLALTDEVTEKITDQYKGMGPLMVLEIDAFSACIVATAVLATDIPEDEIREIVDIYLGLWVDVAVKNHQGVSETALKGRMDSLWLEYSRPILQAYSDPTPHIVQHEDGPALQLVRGVDKVARVQRDEVREGVTAISFKATISEAIRIVTDHAA
ncbi:hypothetical protein [Shinella sp. M27]|uniref:hypothetical protein n=1 Tax=Shinella sp. M27 TaxID=3368614 RepID=UPI003BA1A531